MSFDPIGLVSLTQRLRGCWPQLWTGFVEKVYGARFDRNTLGHLKQSEKLMITNTYFIKEDVYLVIEGQRIQE